MNKKQFPQILVSLLFLATLLPAAMAILPGSAMADLASSAWPMYMHDLKHTGRSPYTGPQTNAVKWTFQTNGSVESCPVIGSDGTIYFTADSDKLYAVNPDGSLKWSFAANFYTNNPVVSSDGTIYIVSEDGVIYAINSDGSQKWTLSTGDNSGYACGPAISSNGTIYTVIYYFDLGTFTVTGHFYAIKDNGTSGSVKWRVELPGGDWFYDCSPAIGSDGTIYIGSDEGMLYALEDKDTYYNIKWSYPVSNYIAEASPAIGSDGTIYMGSSGSGSDTGISALTGGGSFYMELCNGRLRQHHSRHRQRRDPLSGIMG